MRTFLALLCFPFMGGGSPHEVEYSLCSRESHSLLPPWAPESLPEAKRALYPETYEQDLELEPQGMNSLMKRSWRSLARVRPLDPLD